MRFRVGGQRQLVANQLCSGHLQAIREDSELSEETLARKAAAGRGTLERAVSYERRGRSFRFARPAGSEDGKLCAWLAPMTPTRFPTHSPPAAGYLVLGAARPPALSSGSKAAHVADAPTSWPARSRGRNAHEVHALCTRSRGCFGLAATDLLLPAGRALGRVAVPSEIQ